MALPRVEMVLQALIQLFMRMALQMGLPLDACDACKFWSGGGALAVP